MRPHLFKPKDVLRVLRSIRYDADLPGRPFSKVYASIYIELAHQISEREFSAQEVSSAEGLRRNIEFGAEHNPKWFRFIMIDMALLVPSTTAPGVYQAIRDFINGLLGK